MKSPNNILFILLLSVALNACKKSAADFANEVNPAPGGTKLLMGNFMRSSHTTSGTVKIVRDSSNRRFLVFENFRTDNGPDLRVWLSPNTGTSQYREAGRLTAVSGNFSYELDAAADPIVYNHVLIWCEDFSVLFGYAVLQ